MIEESHETFENKYLLKNLNPVFQEIYDCHTENAIEYSFSPEAHEFLKKISERVKMGINETNLATIDHRDPTKTEELEPIKSIAGSKYVDHLGRLSLALHLFESVLQQMLGFMAGQIQIPTQIELPIVKNAERLIAHILKQNEMMINVSMIFI